MGSGEWGVGSGEWGDGEISTILNTPKPQNPKTLKSPYPTPY